MITIYSDDHRYQHAAAELIDGQMKPPMERPDRADRVLAQVQTVSLGVVLPPKDFGLAPIQRIHDAGYVAFLQSAWDQWRVEHGDYDALPLNWAIRTMRSDRIPDAIDGKLSYYSFDAATPITAGTWKAITASANVALTGQALMSQGEQAVFALCRPPGHHAGRDFYGGYCFLNNAAIAAQALCDRGAERVAILDVDYHHGNGTQAIFYDRADILFVSIHADPSQEYPYFLGYADETGTGRGEGYTRNYPLPWYSDWQAYQAALNDALAQICQFAPEVLIVSLGLDTFDGDPISRFRLKCEDYLQIGHALSALNVPTLFVLEGGYAVDELGTNVVNVLLAFEDRV